ncbi:MAG: choice-of-anchor B family protein [Flavobacteriales bacterium]|nr:choice-of-anchor B family protein [Flavobacteriales bacterium]
MRTSITIFILFLSFFATGQNSRNVSILNRWDGAWVDTNNSGVKYNEVWGFVQGGEEYAVMGSVNGAHFFPLTKDDDLVEVGFVAGNFQGNVIHRDYHDYKGYLYAVADQAPGTLQIIDLQYLPDSVSKVYDSDTTINVAHNVFIDSSSGLMYACDPPGTGMKVFSLADPLNPVLVYDHISFSYVHDVYARNDTAYLASGSDGLWIYDFSTPSSPVNLGSLTSYPEQGFNHSGWLSEDGKTYIMADETEGKKLKVVDVSDLSDINIHSIFGTEWWDRTVPHNVMFINDLAYISYYNDGLQIFDIRDLKNPKQIAFYDTFSGENDKLFQGAWGIYAMLPSGKLLISDRSSGLFVFEYHVPPPISGGHGIYPNPAGNEAWFHREHNVNSDYRLQIISSDGKLVEELSGFNDQLRIDLTDYRAGAYLYRYINEVTGVTESGKFLRFK